MSGNVLTVSANGIENHLQFVNVFREYEDELLANGMEYEEHDRKAEPVSTMLIISVSVTTLITTALAEVVKKIVNRMFDESEAEKSKNPAQPTIIIMRIGREEFDLREDRDAIIARIAALETTSEKLR